MGDNVWNGLAERHCVRIIRVADRHWKERHSALMQVERSGRDQGWLYVSAVFGLSVLLTAWMASMIRWGESNRVIAAIWILGFFCVVLNLSYSFVITLCSFFFKPKPLPEAALSEVPAT